MNTDTLKALQFAKDAFEKTEHDSHEERAALRKWRDLCETEEEEQIPISAYMRRKTNRERRAKENSVSQKQIPKQGVKHECSPKAQTTPRNKKKRNKKGVRPNWWENY